MASEKKREGAKIIVHADTPLPKARGSSQPPGRGSGFRKRHSSSEPPKAMKGDERPDAVEGTSSFALQLLAERDEKRAELNLPAQDEAVKPEILKREQAAMEKFETLKRQILTFEFAIVQHERIVDGDTFEESDEEGNEWLRKAALFLFLDRAIKNFHASACASRDRDQFSMFHDVRAHAHEFMAKHIFCRTFAEALEEYEASLMMDLEAYIQLSNRNAIRKAIGEIKLGSFDDFYDEDEEWKPQLGIFALEVRKMASPELKDEHEEAIESFVMLGKALEKVLEQRAFNRFEPEEHLQWNRRATIFKHLLETVRQMHETAIEMDTVGGFCVSEYIREWARDLMENRYFEKSYGTFDDNSRRSRDYEDDITMEVERMFGTLQAAIGFFGIVMFSRRDIDDIVAFDEQQINEMRDAIALAHPEKIPHATPASEEKES
jgi:hypothetical protein